MLINAECFGLSLILTAIVLHFKIILIFLFNLSTVSHYFSNHANSNLRNKMIIIQYFFIATFFPF